MANESEIMDRALVLATPGTKPTLTDAPISDRPPLECRHLRLMPHAALIYEGTT
jgi:hypothetical protein